MEWDEKEHPRDGKGQFATKDTYSNMSIEELKAIAQKPNLSQPLSDLPTVRLPRNEYAMVMSELATNLTKKEHESLIITRNIRNHTYKVVNMGFGCYRVIGKWEIKEKRKRK